MNDKKLQNMETGRKRNGTFTKGPTLAKVIRDANLMKDLASYVILIDECGNVLQSYSNPPFADTLDCIVVLAPAEFCGVHIKEAVAFEIGISRFVPGNATEFISTSTGTRKVIQKRTYLGTLPWSVVVKMLPVLWVTIQHAIDSRMESWTQARFIQSKDQSNKSFSVFESWMTIRIPKEYSLLYAILRLKDEQDRLLPGKNYAHVAETLQKEFDIFFSLNHRVQNQYEDELVKKSSTLRVVAEKIAKNISYRGYTKRSIAMIRKLLLDKDKKYLELFDQICIVFLVKNAEPDDFLDVHEAILGTSKGVLLAGCPLRPCLVHKYEKQRGVHAKDSLTIGIFGSYEHMRELDIRNTQARLLGVADVTVRQENDDDIPF